MDFHDTIDAIRADLGNADYSTVVNSDQIHDLVHAVGQLTDLVEYLRNRIKDLEKVQNERASD